MYHSNLTLTITMKKKHAVQYVYNTYTVNGMTTAQIAVNRSPSAVRDRINTACAFSLQMHVRTYSKMITQAWTYNRWWAT